MTAVFTLSQTKNSNELTKTPIAISVFAGRIADAGVDPKVEITNT